MPITADLGGKSYTLGRGRVFFDRFAAGITVTADTVGEGERYFGNTPSFSTTSSSEDLDHFSSEGGIKVKDDSVQLSLDRTGKVTVDHISVDNIALYFLGNADVLAQASNAAITQVFPTMLTDHFYQLGQSSALPQGHRKVTVATVKSGVAFATTHVVGTDYQVDEALGRVYVMPGGSIPPGADIQVIYAVAATSIKRVVSASNSVYGAIRFVADNPKGENIDYYLPYVKLAPDGDYELKGDDWQTIGFTLEILKKASNVEALIATGRGT